MQQFVSKQLGQQNLNGLAEEFIYAVGKKFFRLRVYKDDPARRIDNQDSCRSGDKHRPGHSFAECGSSFGHNSFPERTRKPET